MVLLNSLEVVLWALFGLELRQNCYIIYNNTLFFKLLMSLIG